MISVSQDWKDLQRTILRSEGFVDIISDDATIHLTKRNFQTFRYRQSGKLDNSAIPTGEIYVEIIKSSTLNYDLDTSKIYKLQFGFDISGAPEMIDVGYFMIKDKSIPANGLVAKYTFTDNFTAFDNTSDPFLLNEVYKGGSDNMSKTAYFDAKALFKRVGGDTTSVYYINTQVGHSLEKCSYAEALQQIALVCGKLLQCKPTAKYERFELNTDIFLVSLTDYVIYASSQFEKPETEHEKPVKNYVVLGNQIDIPNGWYIGSAGNTDVINVSVPANSEIAIELETGKYISLDWDRTHWSGSCDFVENTLIVSNTSSSTGSLDVKLLNTSITQTKPYTFNIANEGDEITISSPLLFYAPQGVTQYYVTNAITCGNYLQQCGSYRDVVSVPCRIDPRLELFDYITLELPDGSQAQGYVERFTINFNGNFSGEVEMRIRDTIPILPTPSISVGLLPNVLQVNNFNDFPSGTTFVLHDDLTNTDVGTFNNAWVSLPSILGSGNYLIRVRAQMSSYVDSKYSNSVSVSIPLSTPTSVVNDAFNTFTMVVDDNTEEIEVFVDDESIGTLEV